MLRVVATADWHLPTRLGKGPWDDVGAGNDPFDVLELVATYCAKNGYDLVAAGDLYNSSRPDADCIERTMKALSPLREAGCDLWYIIGNHDGGQDWLSAFSDFCTNVTTKPTKEVTGLDFQASWPPDFTKLSNRRTKLPPIGLYHQCWTDWFGGGKASTSQLPLHAVSVCGDIHIQGIVQVANGSIAISPGPLVPMKHPEIETYGKGQFYKLESFSDDEPDRICLKEFTLPSRQFTAVKVAQDPEAALTVVTSSEPNPKAPYALQKPIVCLVGPFPDGFEEAAIIAAKRSDCLVAFRGGKVAKKKEEAKSVTRGSSVNLLVDAIKSSDKLDDKDKDLAVTLVNGVDSVDATLSEAQKSFMES